MLNNWVGSRVKNPDQVPSLAMRPDDSSSVSHGWFYSPWLWPPCVAVFSSYGFFFLSSYFLAYSQLSQIRCLLYLHIWCGLSAKLGCRSEMCCTQLVENTGCKKSPNIGHLCTIAQLCRTVSSQLRHVSTIGKNLLNSNISSTCPHNMANFSPLTAEIGLSVSLGHLCKFQWFCVLPLLLLWRRSL